MLATMMLADLGAQVTKVERPGTGDETRTWAPPSDERGEATYFQAVNRNKQSLVLDLGLAADRSRARGLAVTADVVVENFRPGVMERLGLGYEELAAANIRVRLGLRPREFEEGDFGDRTVGDARADEPHLPQGQRSSRWQNARDTEAALGAYEPHLPQGQWSSRWRDARNSEAAYDIRAAPLRSLSLADFDVRSTQ